jgi:hypothetical protein
MGLLDDAIREHLELKRLRGADPGEVAREQREALDPVPGTAPTAPVGSAPAGDDPSRESQPAHGPDFSNVGQETAELDMRTVLGAEHAPPAAHAPSAAADGAHEAAPVGSVPVGAVGGASAAEHPEEDSLEWEVPGGASGESGTGAGGHEHDAGDDGPAATAGEQGDAEEPAEDMLEETPDFLRDTPEQERLWFEQRPPRDFDFDK